MTSDSGGTPSEGLTRREALKRGAAVGGALLWATPVVQSIGMSRAIAQETSDNCVVYCIKYEFTGGDDDLLGVWTELGRGGHDDDGADPAAHKGHCFTCPPGAQNVSFPPGFFTGFEVFGGTRTEGVWIRYPDSCSLVQTDSSPDELAEGAAAAKCGSGAGSCNFVPWIEEDRPDPDKPGFNRVWVSVCTNGSAMSHIELILRCCPS